MKKKRTKIKKKEKRKKTMVEAHMKIAVGA